MRNGDLPSYPGSQTFVFCVLINFIFGIFFYIFNFGQFDLSLIFIFGQFQL